MINAADVRLEYYTAIALREGASGIFSVRITYEGAVPASGLKMWFRAGETSEQSKELPTLNPGKPHEEQFSWEAKVSGGIKIIVGLGVPEKAPSEDERRLAVYSRSLEAQVLAAPRTPHNLSQAFHFGKYQVGDIGIREGEPAGRVTGRGRRRSYAPADARSESDWEVLELRYDDVATRLRRFEQLFEEAEATLIRGRTARMLAQTQPSKVEEARELLASALKQFASAQDFALAQLRNKALAEQCGRKLEEVSAELPRDRELNRQRFEEMVNHARGVFVRGRTALMLAQPDEARELLDAALNEFREAQRFALDVVAVSELGDVCAWEIEKVLAELEKAGRATATPGDREASRAPKGEDRGGILRRVDGTMEVHVLTKAVVSWGRHSQRDVFLAREPFERPPGEPPWNLKTASEEQRNYARSTDLSRHHFDTRWNGTSFEICDRSKHGVWLERAGSIKRLVEGQQTALAHGDRLHLSGSPGSGDGPVLSLEVVHPGLGLGGVALTDHPTGFARGATPAPGAVVLRRLGNRPERSCLLLAAEAVIGRHPDNAVVLAAEGVDETHGSLTLVSGRLAVRRVGAGRLMVNDRELARDETVQLPDSAEIRVGSVPMRFRRFDSSDQAVS